MRPTRHDMRASRVLPRGARFDPWDGRSFALVPDTLRPGVDRVKLLGAYLRRVRGATNKGLYMGYFRGCIACLFDGEDLARLMPAWMFGEDRPVTSSVSIDDFRDGFLLGTQLEISMARISLKSAHRKPSDHGRGTVCGYEALEKRRYTLSWVEGYNETARRLAIRYPDEHWVGGPS